MVADGVVNALGGRHVRGVGSGSPPGHLERSGPDGHDRRVEAQVLLSAGICNLHSNITIQLTRLRGLTRSSTERDTLDRTSQDD